MHQHTLQATVLADASVSSSRAPEASAEGSAPAPSAAPTPPVPSAAPTLAPIIHPAEASELPPFGGGRGEGPSLSEASELPPFGGGRGEGLLFSRYIEPHIPLIRARVAAMTPHPRDVGDNLQEVLVHLYLNVHRYAPTGTVPTIWITTVVINAMNNINRPAASAPTVIPLDTPIANPSSAASASSASDDDDAPDGDPDADVPAPAKASELPPQSGSTGEGHLSAVIAAFMLNLDDVHHALLAALPEDERNIIILHASGWPVRDIAADLGLPPHTVSNRLLRLKKRLRQSAVFNHKSNL